MEVNVSETLRSLWTRLVDVFRADIGPGALVQIYDGGDEWLPMFYLLEPEPPEPDGEPQEDENVQEC